MNDYTAEREITASCTPFSCICPSLEVKKESVLIREVFQLGFGDGSSVINFPHSADYTGALLSVLGRILGFSVLQVRTDLFYE